jgi:integrase
MPKLTENFVKDATAKKNERLEYTDEGCIGLRLRVTEKGKVWGFLARGKGQHKTVRLTLGRYPAMTLTKARAAASAERAKLEGGQDIRAEAIAAKRECMTFGELADRYLAHAERTKASWKNDKGYLQRPLAEWRDKPATGLKRKDFADLLEDIATNGAKGNGPAPVSANRTQSVLRTMIGLAVERGWLEENRLAGAKKIGGKEEAKDRLLSDAELKTLWAAMNDPLSPTTRAVELALHTILLTCARPGEVAGMRVEELSLDGPFPVWTIPKERVKNRRAHMVPLSPLAVETIKEALADRRRGVDGESPYVFASKFASTASIARHSLSQATRRMCQDKFNKEHGLKPFTPHDLRRTGATLCRAAGVPRDSVKALLNHKDQSVTGVYDQYDMLKEKCDAVEKLAEWLTRIVA